MVRPFRTSQIESSHRRPVADLKWIGFDSEIGPKGGRRSAKEDKECHQLVTVASDGAMCEEPLLTSVPIISLTLRVLQVVLGHAGAAGGEGGGFLVEPPV